ncbi:hypothetical protein [Pseudoduganella armeniaca]|uniref:Uncharacterized protein n=1 Tax=Pseudoduganella armeniaca TaxID=2072590 RepID=A0A2R4CDA4_9BURK|nr:hypothetical protein [Pseudoduganella armeniaca]AVR97448.1 hypothetical protein C9I28_18730 [Pseudoduganella armeniaca]
MTAATPTERRATLASAVNPAQGGRGRVLPLLFPFLLVVAALVVDGLLFYRADRVPTAVPVGIALALLILLMLKHFWGRRLLAAACCLLAGATLAAVYLTPLRATQIQAVHTARFLAKAPAYRAEAARAPLDAETGRRYREWRWETQPVASTTLIYDESDALARRVKPHQGQLAEADQVYPVAPHFYVVVGYAL